jgi:hypothetical protein
MRTIVLDVRQKRILLRLIKAVNFVDKEDGLLPLRRAMLGHLDDSAQFRHSARDGRERHEMRFC